jgi:hypothetical protein
MESQEKEKDILQMTIDLTSSRWYVTESGWLQQVQSFKVF